MSALTAAELAGVQADLTALSFHDRCDVQRTPAVPADAYGHAPPPSWAAHLTGIACRYWQLGGRTAIEVTETVQEQHRLAVPHGTDVREQDRISAVRGPDGAPRTARALRIDAVVPRASHVECTLAEVAW